MKQFAILALLVAFIPAVFAQGAKPADPNAAALASLQGKWVINSLNGQTAEGGMEISLTFTGDKYAQTMNGEVNERGTIKLDASKKPMTIDLIITEGGDAGKTQLGVFEVTADKLTANFDIPGAGQRPADLAPREGSLLFVATKAK
jgi:uncharacterized protein (TIGR03067 family)